MLMQKYMATAGECGLRGGYMELLNIHPGTIEEMYKIASINLSPNTMGQVLMLLDAYMRLSDKAQCVCSCSPLLAGKA